MPLPCGKGSEVTSAALLAATQGGAELGEHVLLPLTDALGVEAQEASLLCGVGDRHARHHRRANHVGPLLFGEIGVGAHCTALLARQNGRPYTLVCAPSTRSTGLTKICAWSRFRKVKRSGSSRATARSAPQS